MILVKEMPTSGQFVAVWEHDGVMKSAHYQWYDGKLFYWWDACDEWEECSVKLLIENEKQVEYITQNLAIS